MLLIILLGIFSLLFGQSLTHITYKNDNSNFPNAERGFYHAVSRIDYHSLLSYRKEGITLVFKTYHLNSFKNSPISNFFLRGMEQDFETLRKAGAKAVIRFSYTDKLTPPFGDARPEIVLMHVKQLKPVLKANSDVILILQAGFIGAWGEWYYTDYYSVSPGVVSKQNWADRRQLVDSLLKAIPADRMVQVRTPYYKKDLLEMDSYKLVTPEDAYKDLPIARIAHHNDCFVAGPSDYGTYLDSTVEKPYLAEDSKYTIVGGETCNKCAQSVCSNAVKELRRFHWTFLNLDYNQSVLGEWKDQGCFTEVQRKLGYRFRLLNAYIQDNSKPGGTFHLMIKMVNDGWANPTNPRPVEIIFKNKTNGKTYYVNPEGDMRLWPIHDTIHINITAGLPKDIEPGDYGVFINFPDADARLSEKHEYSIRLANVDVWDPVSGYNSLNHIVKVDTSVQAPAYYGGNYFKEKNSIFSRQTHIIIDGNVEDWENIPITYSATDQAPQTLKLYNTADTLFVLITGNNFLSHNRILLNTDNDTVTGAYYGPWKQSGFDYMIDSNRFLQYTGTNHEFTWSFLSQVSVVRNDKVVELKIPFSQLNLPKNNYTLSLGYENINDQTSKESYLPLAGKDLIYYQKNNTAGYPEAIMCKNYGTHNIIYWTRDLQSKNVFTVLQKSVSGGNFEDLGILRNDKIVYLDKNLQPGDKVSYRIQYKEGNNLSAFSDTIYKTISDDQGRYAEIHLDGNPDDWDVVPPSATGFVHGTMASTCFFNDRATDSLYFAIDGKIEKSYRVNFDINGDGTFDWFISNDSLFSIVSGESQFKKLIPSYRNSNFLESGIKMSETGLDTANIFGASLFIDGRDVWGNDEHFSFMKYQPPSSPKYFNLGTLTEHKWSRIKITWFPDQSPEGYEIERSVNDSLHFKQLVKLDNTKFQYIDKNLDSTTNYYYRMFSYKNSLRSPYTGVKGMRPGRSLGINSIINHNASVTIIPNPVKQYGQIEISLAKPDIVRVSLYSLNGQKIIALNPRQITGKTIIPLDVTDIKAGYYLLKISGEKTLLFKKIIIL